jgi:glutamyl-tRNA reductase
VVDTCNRYEVICEPATDGAASACRQAVQQHVGDLPLHDHTDVAAVHHLLRVAVGLDSMVPGEDEILGQVTRAFRDAEAAGMSSCRLQSLGNRLTAAARRLRQQRPRRDVPDSVATLAAQIVRRHGDVIAVIGAGAMARTAAHELRRQGARELVFVNRSVERAKDLAAHFHGRSLALDQFLLAPPSVHGLVLALCGRPLVLPLAALPQLRCVVDISQPSVLDASARARTDLCVLDLQSLSPHAEAACRGLADWVAETGALAAGHAQRLWLGLDDTAPELGHVVELHVEAAREELTRARRNGLANLDGGVLEHVAALVERVARRNAHLHLQDLKGARVSP